MKKRIKAFTLMEMVIVMLLTGMVVSTAFKCFQIIYSSYLDLKQRNEALSLRAQLDILLSLDFLKCSHVLKKENRIECIYPSYTVNYMWEGTVLLRRQHSRTDTFFVAPSEFSFLFQDKPPADGNEMIDEMSFESTYNNELQKFRYKKYYDAETMMHGEELLTAEIPE